MRKYKFKIKKENERCLEYLVEDHDPEEENIKFTIPLAFQVRRCVFQSENQVVLILHAVLVIKPAALSKLGKDLPLARKLMDFCSCFKIYSSSFI